jgi:hypothetical protein
MHFNLKSYILILFVSFSMLSFASPLRAGPPDPLTLPPVATSTAQTPPCDSTNQSYCLLAPLPLGVNADGSVDASTPNTKIAPDAYIRGIFNLAIALAGVVAVIQLVVAGFKYISIDSVTGKETAKGDIQNALLGLILAIGAFSILQAINPRLVELSLSIPAVKDPGAITPQDSCAGTIDATTKGCNQPSGEGPDGTVFTCDNVKPPTCNYRVSGNSGGWGPLPNGTDLNGIPLKQSCQSFDGTPGFPCQVSNQTFFQGLLALTQTMPSGSWRVTEAWPPSYKGHIDTCHKPGIAAGDCVDASLTSNPATPAQIKNFLDAINDRVTAKQFMNFQYEVGCPKPTSGTTCTDPASLKRLSDIQAVTGSYVVKINIGATGEHAHINYK